jgi:uncharacterized protein
MRKLLPIVLVLFASQVFGEDKDIAELRKRAEAGSLIAQCNLGVMYANGQGVAKDMAEALKWWRKAAEQGHADSQNNLGTMYADKKNNYKEAVKWWRKAAEQGVRSSQFNLAVQYQRGRSVQQDFKEAAHWHHKAAVQNHTVAMFNLAAMYADGRGVQKDYIHSYAWFSITVGKGIVIRGLDQGEERLKKLAEIMTPDQIAEAQEMSKELLKKIEANKAAKK